MNSLKCVVKKKTWHEECQDEFNVSVVNRSSKHSGRRRAGIVKILKTVSLLFSAGKKDGLMTCKLKKTELFLWLIISFSVLSAGCKWQSIWGLSIFTQVLHIFFPFWGNCVCRVQSSFSHVEETFTRSFYYLLWRPCWNENQNQPHFTNKKNFPPLSVPHIYTFFSEPCSSASLWPLAACAKACQSWNERESILCKMKNNRANEKE